MTFKYIKKSCGESLEMGMTPESTYVWEGCPLDFQALMVGGGLLLQTHHGGPSEQWYQCCVWSI